MWFSGDVVQVGALREFSLQIVITSSTSIGRERFLHVTIS